MTFKDKRNNLMKKAFIGYFLIFAIIFCISLVLRQFGLLICILLGFYFYTDFLISVYRKYCDEYHKEWVWYGSVSIKFIVLLLSFFIIESCRVFF